MDFDLFPDSELLVTEYLNGAAWAPLVKPHVGAVLRDAPNFGTGEVMIRRVGGLPAERHRLDSPEIQVDAWATPRKLARDVAAKALQLLSAAEGATYSLPDGTRAFLAGVAPSIGLSFIFDPLNLTPRYMFSVRLTVHAL